MNSKLFLLFTFLFPLLAMAGNNPHGSLADACDPDNKTDRDKWFQEAREYKHRFLAREINLTKEQQKEFFELYDKMEDETMKLQKETRQMEQRVMALGDTATDLDYEKATDALYESKEKEAAIEKRYREAFKKILSPEQQFKLKGAERKFMKDLMDKGSRQKADRHQHEKKTRRQNEKKK